MKRCDCGLYWDACEGSCLQEWERDLLDWAQEQQAAYDEEWYVGRRV